MSDARYLLPATAGLLLLGGLALADTAGHRPPAAWPIASTR